MSANQVNAFFQRLSAENGEYNKAKVGELGALDAVMLDLKPEVASIGQTIRINFPDVSAFQDQEANDWVPDDASATLLDVPFGQRPGKGILIRSFEQWLTSTNIMDQFIDPMYKRAMEYGNGQIFAQVNSTNFPATATAPAVASYAPITTVPAELDVGSARLAWNVLVRNKVPIRGPQDATILYHPDVHANTLTDPAWAAENIVGARIAEDARQNDAGGMANGAFRFKRRHDVQAPTGTSTNRTGTVTVANGSTAVTGSSTKFLSEVAAVPSTTPPAPGNTVWLTFGADTVSYPVQSVTSDTALTLATPYTGSLTSGNTYTRVTYTGVAMHRFAIALAVRPLPLVNNEGTQSRLVKLGPIGFPVRVMLSYQHLKDGWLLTMDYGMAVKVIRPDFGVMINS